eukprot:m.16116 g.16116  ORF g.16116 m.16116 type:complete len:193 (-) comp4569_c0_seq1:423-1001(-)
MNDNGSEKQTRDNAPPTPPLILAFFLAFPSLLVVIVPYVILMTGFGYQVPFHQVTSFRFFGTVPITGGAFISLWAMWDLLVYGRLKLPIFTLKQLDNGGEKYTFRGVFRYMRNPVYAGICMLLMGQAIYFVSGTLFFYTLGAFAALHLLVILYEEPNFRAIYPQAYADYCRRVPRWLPVWEKIMKEEGVLPL